MDASQLERLMVAQYGPDFRDKAFVNAIGSFRLADAFEECGLVDAHPRPQDSPTDLGFGLWQITR